MKKNISIKNIAIFATLMFTQPVISALHEAVKNNDRATVESLLKDGAHIEELADGDTPLHAASRWGHIDMIELLINERADIEAQNKDGYTPLYLAAGQGYKDIVKQLLQAGASSKQYLILEQALKGGQRADRKRLEDTFKWILQAGASSKRSKQPLMRRPHKGVDSVKTVQLILLMDKSYWEDSLSSQAQELLQRYNFELGFFEYFLKKSKELGKQLYQERSKKFEKQLHQEIESFFEVYNMPKVLIPLIIAYDDCDSFDRGEQLLKVDDRECLLEKVIAQLGTDSEIPD
jgi:hypothetical protein